MKARLVTIGESEIRKQVAEEFDKLKDKVYENVVKNVIPQFTAICMCILHREYGFGEKRLKHFLDSVNAGFEIMYCDIPDKKYSPVDCLNFLKNEYKIDVDKELTNE
ncbi:MAG: hypothetical protein K2H19_09275 [Ruminococcus sp.]|nr:hypothetical protein [Ruminococcus sp.]